MLLLVVEDRHAESALRQALASARARGDDVVVLTADALLAMRLEREGVVARRTIHGMEDPATHEPDGNPVLKSRDGRALEGATAAFGAYATFDGTDFGPYLQYTLIPSFMRAVRNVTAVQDQLATGTFERIVLAGGGALIQAARLVASHRSIATETVGGDFLSRAQQAFARLKAGRATRWVDTEFRALILEPGFMSILFVKGFWRRLTGPAPPPPRPDALIVVGDRFTSDVVERLTGESRQIILAGATQPGRALFANASELVPLEAFVSWRDLLRAVARMIDAAARSLSLATDAAHGREFSLDGVSYWPLVRRAVALHILIWIQELSHVQALAARAANASPRGRLLTSTDVTAYNRVIVDTVRRFGVASTGIQHGITGEPNGHSIVHVDTLATWGPQAEAWYRARAPQTANFVVTGSPRFDALATRVARPNPESRIPNPFTITICTGFMSDFSTGSSDYQNLAMIDTVIAWARSQPGVGVIHKMHPGEELEYYAAAGRALGWDPLKLTTIREPVLHDVLEQSDLLVTAYSSTVLESLVLGTPAIVFDGMVQRRLLHDDSTPLTRVPGVTIVYSVVELHQQLDARRSAPPPDRAALRASPELREYLSGLDGQATARVAGLLG
jgi:hypothetical protein